MTDYEIKKTLKDTYMLVASLRMDKKHIRALLKTLTDALHIKDSAFFITKDMRKNTKKILTNLISSEHLNHRFSRVQMKNIYTLLGDYHIYPLCKLCGQPIKIDTFTQQHMQQSNKLAFSWDHKKPKSLGGSYELGNLQPSHKICNNKRGTEPLKKVKKSDKFDISVDIAITIDLEDALTPKNPRYRPSRFGLRKQDSWCHKQCCQYSR